MLHHTLCTPLHADAFHARAHQELPTRTWSTGHPLTTAIQREYPRRRRLASPRGSVSRPNGFPPTPPPAPRRPPWNVVAVAGHAASADRRDGPPRRDARVSERARSDAPCVGACTILLSPRRRALGAAFPSSSASFLSALALLGFTPYFKEKDLVL